MEQQQQLDVDRVIEECKKSNGLQECLERLYVVEKQTRLGGNVAENLKVQLAMVEASIGAGALDVLGETMGALCKKRSVLKQAITGMVQRCMGFVEGLANTEPAKFLLIGVIREVTEGKIFVEVERARITRLLAGIREGEGRLREAAELMQELQVETFGSMERRERIEFILDQLRLLVTVGEYSKAQIVSRKIAVKAFEAEGVADLKTRYLLLMIQLCLQDGQYLDCARHHHSIWMTGGELGQLKRAALLVVLAKYSPDQASLLAQLSLEPALEEGLPQAFHLLQLFRTAELIRWVQLEPILADMSLGEVRHLDALRERVLEHNLRVLAGCYACVHLGRLAELLDLPLAMAESKLATLISEGMIQGRIDRVAGLVRFSRSTGSMHVSSEARLNDWATRTDALLALLVRTNHAIAKEELESRL